MSKKTLVVCALLSGVALAGAVTAADASTLPDIRITEFMYKNENSPGEFVQFTNLGTTAVNMSGWSEDDGSGKVGEHSLSTLGILQPGESGILAETDAATFDQAWDLPLSTPFADESSKDNLGKSDTIFLFDSSGDIVDELIYGNGSGPSTDGVAAVPDSLAAIGSNDISAWELLTAGQDGAIHADGLSTGDVASPGYSSFAASPVPLPPAVWMLAAGLALLIRALRRRPTTGNAAHLQVPLL